MSLSDKSKDIKFSDLYSSEGICRSKSFGGLSGRQSHSPDVTLSSSDLNFDSVSSRSLQSSLGTVFGHSSSLASARNFIHALSASKSNKIRKTPHPHHAHAIFDALTKGLRDSIHLAQNDISSSRMAFDNVSVSSVMSQGRLYELEKQMKANERLLKKLEFHLAKVEELKEKYDVQHKMRDGIRSMAYAYILSPGKTKDLALQKVKMQFKECTETLCSLENNLESIMGTLLFEMKGIQGFARICCGDVFEVMLKHGDQKWKSRGRVLKNGEQMWENKFMLFKALFAEQLSIKAVEVRGLGKNILLGNKFCEIHNLFCAHPQQMTINLNPSGSLKLNLFITWNPLMSSEDGLNASTGFHSLKRHSISQSSIQEDKCISDDVFIEKENLVQNVKLSASHVSNFSCKMPSLSDPSKNAEIASPDVESSSKISDDISLSSGYNQDSISSFIWVQDTNCNNANLCSSLPSFEVNLEDKDFSSVPCSSMTTLKNNLKEVLRNLIFISKKVVEFYPEMNDIVSVLEQIEFFLKMKHEDDGNDSYSNISVSIANALGCFDFLNSEDNDSCDNLSDDESNLSVHNTNVEVDIDGVQIDSTSLDFTYSSGNEEIDLVLLNHMLCCTKLVNSLVTYCAMKHLTCFILQKLKKQKAYLSCVLQMLEKSNQYTLDDVFAEEEYSVKDLWAVVAGSSLYSLASDFYVEMKRIIESEIELENSLASLVCQHLLISMLDSDEFHPSTNITVFQFKSFFACNKNPCSFLREFAADTLAAEDLKCRDVQKAFAAVSVLSKIIPSSYSLFLIGCLLTEKNSDLKNIAACYLKTIGSNPDKRTKIMLSYTEMLLSDNATHRLVACAALDALDAKSSFEQLSSIDDSTNITDAVIVSNKNENLPVEESLS